MAWTVEASDVAERQLRKLDHSIQKRLLDWLDYRIEGCKNPRHFGEPLKGELGGCGGTEGVTIGSSARSTMMIDLSF